MSEQCPPQERIIDFITGQELPSTNEETVRQTIERLLVEERGYAKEDIEVGQRIHLTIGNETIPSEVDLVVSTEGKRFMIVKCAPGSLVTRERPALSSARLLDSYQIPLAVVTNGEDAEVLDTLSGKVIAQGLEAIPSKDKASENVRQMEFKGLPGNRREKEMRILAAFDAIRCPSECDY